MADTIKQGPMSLERSVASQSARIASPDAQLGIDSRSRVAVLSLVGIAVAIVFSVALVRYHVAFGGTGQASGFVQSFVVWVYKGIGFASALYLGGLVLLWSTIAFLTGRSGGILLRVLASVIFCISLAALTAAFDGLGGELGRSVADRLLQAFGSFLTVALLGVMTVGAALLATDWFFFRSFLRWSQPFEGEERADDAVSFEEEMALAPELAGDPSPLVSRASVVEPERLRVRPAAKGSQDATRREAVATHEPSDVIARRSQLLGAAALDDAQRAELSGAVAEAPATTSPSEHDVDDAAAGEARDAAEASEGSEASEDREANKDRQASKDSKPSVAEESTPRRRRRRRRRHYEDDAADTADAAPAAKSDDWVELGAVRRRGAASEDHGDAEPSDARGEDGDDSASRDASQVVLPRPKLKPKPVERSTLQRKPTREDELVEKILEEARGELDELARREAPSAEAQELERDVLADLDDEDLLSAAGEALEKAWGTGESIERAEPFAAPSEARENDDAPSEDVTRASASGDSPRPATSDSMIPRELAPDRAGRDFEARELEKQAAQASQTEEGEDWATLFRAASDSDSPAVIEPSPRRDAIDPRAADAPPPSTRHASLEDSTPHNEDAHDSEQGVLFSEAPIDEELLEIYAEVVLQERRPTPSLLQRRLGVSYAEAREALETLAAQGAVDPPVGKGAWGPRISFEDWQARRAKS